MDVYRLGPPYDALVNSNATNFTGDCLKGGCNDHVLKTQKLWVSFSHFLFPYWQTVAI